MMHTTELDRTPRSGRRAMALIAAAAATATAIQVAQPGQTLGVVPVAAQTDTSPLAPAATPVTIPASTSQFFLGSDPFRRVRTPTVVVATAGPADPQVVTDDACQAGAVVTCDGQTVRLIDVYAQGEGHRAVVDVDGVGHDVGPGETFAVSYQVLSVEQSCATLLYGDDAFTLCEGEQILK